MSTHLPTPTKGVIDFLTPECTINAISVTSKKKILEAIANTLSSNIVQLKENDLFDSLVQREKLGSTAIGHGCAIPHCRANDIDQVYACFLKLNTPIDFDAPDKEPVDLIFAIVVPEEATELHLNLLAYIAERLRDQNTRKALRDAKSNEDLYQLLTNLS